MSLNLKMANAAVNAQANALATLLNTGYLRIYDGTQPATADTAVSTQNLLAELRFAATAFPTASAGVITANPISAVTAALTGTASWFRALQSDGVTTVLDGSAGAAADSTNLTLGSKAIQAGAQVSVSSFQHTVPK